MDYSATLNQDRKMFDEDIYYYYGIYFNSATYIKQLGETFIAIDMDEPDQLQNEERL